MLAIKEALVLILEDIAERRGTEANCDVINQHFSTVTQANRAEKKARKPYVKIINLLKAELRAERERK